MEPATAAEAPVILQLANVNFRDISAKLEAFKAAGITIIQTSPLQEHCSHVSPWYRLYQPTGSTTLGNSLGNVDEIRTMIVRPFPIKSQNGAHKLGMKVIVDVVLHHVCACPICNRLSKLSTISWWMQAGVRLWDSLRGKHRQFERFNVLDWGPKASVEKEIVFEYHATLIGALRDVGADGYRFDAAKHIPADYFRKLWDACGARTDELWYGEILDGDKTVCEEYIHAVPGMKATDFPLTFRLREIFGLHGDIRRACEPSLSWESSICLADCHDSILGDSYKFDHKDDGILAASFLLARGYGTPLLWHEFLVDSRITAGLKFLHASAGLPFEPLPRSTDTVLFIARGRRGLAVINKSADWIDVHNLDQLPLDDGVWIELANDFTVTISQSRMHSQLKIPPRQVLYLTFATNCQEEN